MTRLFLITVIGGNMFFSCERELDLAQFKDDYGFYEPEIRIEAILSPIQVGNLAPCYQVIVRVDRSITIDDTTIYNGRDDNANWQSFSDENGNGKWDSGEPLNDDLGEDGQPGKENGFPARDKGEGNGRPDYGEPNVDEYDEILPLIHDTTAIVSLTNLTKEINYTLTWTATAARFQYFGRNWDDRLTNVRQSAYGGYVYTGNVIGLADTNDVFLFRIDLPERNLTVTGQTQLIPPAKILDFGFARVQDTLYVPYGHPGGILWSSDPRATTYSVRVDTVLQDGACLLYYEHPNFANKELTAANDEIPIGFEPLMAELTPALYRLVITTMDENYSRYYYSSLPLKDPQMSNLRDQNGNVVMGVAGSKAETAVYLRILPNR